MRYIRQYEPNSVGLALLEMVQLVAAQTPFDLLDDLRNRILADGKYISYEPVRTH